MRPESEPMAKTASGCAIVTGAAGGIGKAIALEFAGRGAAVAAIDRDSAGLDDCRQAVEAAGGRCLSLVCDLADLAHAEAAVRRAARELGPISTLVNNAAVRTLASMRDITPAAWMTRYGSTSRRPPSWPAGPRKRCSAPGEARS